MKRIRISDVTMKQVTQEFSLSFKEKIELAKMLDKLGVSVIELEGIRNSRVDSLRIKSIAAAVQQHRGCSCGIERRKCAGCLERTEAGKEPQTAGLCAGQFCTDGVSVPQEAGGNAGIHHRYH